MGTGEPGGDKFGFFSSNFLKSKFNFFIPHATLGISASLSIMFV